MNSTPKKSKYSAAIITIVICIILAVGAVAISLLSPGSEFEIIPSTIKPGEVHFSEMQYERPDPSTITESIDELIEMINEGKSFTEQSRLFTDINDDLTNFRTMMSLADIHYYADTSDEFYRLESEYLNSSFVDIHNKICVLLDTIESSSVKVNYERSFLGNNYFDNWKPMTKSPEAIELMKTEQELIAEYQATLSGAFVNYNGEDIYINSEEFSSFDSDDQTLILGLYYQKYNPILGGIYAQLVKIRLAIAEELGTDYISYAYESFGRDYTPEQANAYMDSIVQNLIPVIASIDYSPSALSKPADPITSFYTLSLAANKMGGETKKAFDYMVEFGLYDLSASSSKMGLSFEIFLDKYNAPFIFASATGSTGDYITYAHEFGHFVYDYTNLGMGKTVDSAEVASQAMAYIMPLYSDGMGNISGEDFLKSNLYSTFDMYLYSCFINKLETAAYSLSPEEVSADKLNELARAAALEIGLSEASADYLANTWFEVQHIYISPMYYVSYAISNDAALQILEAELEDPGKGGIKAFERFISKDHALPLSDALKNEGFESPFSEGRAEKIADLIDGIFNPQKEDSPKDAA